MKKFFASMALMGMFAMNASAQFAGGTGTESDPYQVATAEQLQAVNDFLTASFVQTADIDLSEMVWKPIGTFTGHYNGQGFAISGLTIETGEDGLGVFNRVNEPAVLENIVIRDCYIVANRWSGILCSTNGNWEAKGGLFRNCYIYDSSIEGTEWIGAFAGVSGGSFENCHAINVNVEGSGNGIGGISGDSEAGGHYWNCTFYGSIIGTTMAGGICAFYNGNCLVDNCFENCAVYGNITSSGGCVGGIMAAPNWNVSNSNVINCSVFANVSGPGVGGIGGNAVRGKMIRNYVTGNITATDIYYHDNWEDPWNGGLCAVNFNGPIEDSYFSGTITAKVDGVKTAGISGRNWDGLQVKACYYNSDGATMGMGDGDNPDLYETYGVMPEDMQTLSTFKFSDMSKWQIVEGQTTPFFINQTAPLTVTECNTNRIAGTGEADLERVIIIGSMSETLRNEVTIENGNWSIELGEDDVVASETVTVIGFAKDKMPSMVTKAKVEDATGIKLNESAENEAAAPAYNVQGQRIDAGYHGITIVKGKKIIR